MALFFPQQLATQVDLTEGGDVRIRQYSGDSCEEEIGQVVLTKHQFSEIFNREKQIGKD